MEFRVLGPVEVRDRGALVDIGGAKAVSLVAALLAHHDRPISQGRLAEALWPGSSRSRDTLQSYVSRVRRQLGPEGRDLLVRTRDGYSLTTGGHLDADRFENLLDDGTAALESQDPATAARLVREGLGLWRGHAFGELAADELVFAEAIRLEELRLGAHETWAVAELALDHHGQVAGELENLCESHPLRERLWELLMVALVRSGRQAEALRAYQRAREKLVEELGIEPSERLRRTEQMILAQDPALELPDGAPGGPGRPTSTGTASSGTASSGTASSGIAARGADASCVEPANVHLPPDLTRFIGRTREVAVLVRLLDGTRLLTLTGMGGVGKTRLAIEVARRVGAAHPGGIGLVDLSPVSDPGEVAASVATCLEQIDDRAGAQGLVIVDNCEHLIDTCAEVLARTMTARPSVRFLATSREPLRLPSETRWRVEPMAPPVQEAGPDELAGNDAAQLFVDRARATRPEIELDDTALIEIGAICRRLDGIPLAIEIAAALVGSMGLSQIEHGLADRFELLREGFRTAPPRQQTLAGMFDWSYELLDDEDKRLLQQIRPLNVTFGFPRRAAEVVCADDPLEEPRIGAGLGRLVDRSFVQMDPGGGEAIYRILPTIGQFIWERTGWQGGLESRAFVLRLAIHTEPRLRGSLEQLWAALFGGSTDVARAAMDLAYHLHDLEAGSFLAGLAAGRLTSADRVGFIGGVRSRYIARFELGYRAGIAHGSDVVELEASYLSDAPDFSGFMDIARARAACTELFGRGCDIVFHTAGELGGQGVFEAARGWHEATGERRWVIGVDLDEAISREVSLRPYALTSMRRRIPLAPFLEIKDAVARGRPDRAPLLDLSNEGVGLGTTGGGIDDLSPELDAVRRGIVAGEIAVPRLELDAASWWAPPDADG